MDKGATTFATGANAIGQLSIVLAAMEQSVFVYMLPLVLPRRQPNRLNHRASGVPFGRANKC